MSFQKTNAQIRVLSSEDSSAITKAAITVSGQSKVFYTNESGYAQIPSLDSNSKVSVKKHGFDSLTNIKAQNGMIVFLNPHVTFFETFVYTNNPGEKKRLRDELANIRVIGKTEIRSTAAQNLGDILKYQPNVNLNFDPVLGTSISINGMSGQNVKLLKNGATISGAMNGSIDVSQINLANVEQIEVIEGPMSLLYGSNALAGTINIISKFPIAIPTLFAKTYSESSGIYNVVGGFGDKVGKLRFNASLGRNFFDGWNPGDKFFFSPVNRMADTSRSSLWKPREQIIGDLAFYLPINKYGNIRFNHDLLIENILSKGAPQSPYFESAFDDYFKTFRNTNSFEINYKKDVVAHNVLGSFAIFKRTKNTFLKDLTSTGKGLLTGYEDQDTTLILTSQLRYIGAYDFKKHKLNYGVDFNHETFDGKRVQGNGKSIYNISFVAIYSAQLKERLNFKIGVRQTLHSKNKVPLIPSFSAKYDIDKHTNVKFTAAKAYRAPGIKELYLYFVDINHNIIGNPDLKAESSENFNLMVTRNKKHGKNFLFHWQVNAYYNQFRNLITLAAISLTEYTYVNIGKSSIRGINSELGVDFGRFEFNYRNAIISNSNNIDAQGIPDYFTTINHNMNATFDLIPKKHIRLNAFVNRFGKSPYVAYENNNPIMVHNQSYWMIDLTTMVPFTIKSLNFNFTGGLRNLANISNIRSGINSGTAHQSSNAYRAVSTGRTIFFGLELNL